MEALIRNLKVFNLKQFELKTSRKTDWTTKNLERLNRFLFLHILGIRRIRNLSKI
jgi:hypothetical protein